MSISISNFFPISLALAASTEEVIDGLPYLPYTMSTCLARECGSTTCISASRSIEVLAFVYFKLITSS